MKGNLKPKSLYLVISPIIPTQEILLVVAKALAGGVDFLQLSGPENFRTYSFAESLFDLAEKNRVPFLINNNLRLAKEINCQGIHFDSFEISPKQARRTLGTECLVGYTVNVNLDRVRWAEDEGADYVSFCSVFNSCSTNQCPIVSLDTLKKARGLSAISIFAAGGVNQTNAHVVLEIGLDGIVVSSSILNAKEPEKATREFKQIIRRYERSI